MSESLLVLRRILPSYGTDQDDSGSPSAYFEAGAPGGSPQRRPAAYFIGTDTRGREFEMILAPDDQDDDLWIAVHALQTGYRKNG